jgi:hypothetical protein
MIDSERVAFRYVVGALAMLGGIGGLIGLYITEVPAGNRDALMLALGLVLGWGSSIVNGEWGSSPAGRQAAAVGVRLAEVAGPPTGTVDNPTIVEGAGPNAEPVPTREG